MVFFFALIFASYDYDLRVEACEFLVYYTVFKSGWVHGKKKRKKKLFSLFSQIELSVRVKLTLTMISVYYTCMKKNIHM